MRWRFAEALRIAGMCTFCSLMALWALTAFCDAQGGR